MFVPITPCRLADLRPAPDTVGPRSAALGPAETYTLSGWGTVGNCTLPSGTAALSLNVTALNPSAATYLTLFPADATRPLTANLNPTPGQPPTPNAVTVDLNSTGQFSIYNLAGDVGVVVDVVGYYDDHDHDDRYYTKAQVDAAVAAATAAATAAAAAAATEAATEAAKPVVYATGSGGVVGFPAIATTPLDVATLDLPAGAYVLSANLVANNNTPAATATVGCSLTLGATLLGGLYDGSLVLNSNGGAGERESIAFNGAGTLAAPGTARLSCQTTSTIGNYLGASIVATSVGSVTAP